MSVRSPLYEHDSGRTRAMVVRAHGFAQNTVSAILDAEVDGLDTLWHMTFDDLIELKTDGRLDRHEM